MDPTLKVNDMMLVAITLGLIGQVVFPVLLGLWLWRRLNVSLKYFGYGALIFFLFQLITRIPLQIGASVVLAPWLQAALVNALIWATISALTAGLAEEIGRYVGYRWLMGREEKTWHKAVMYGAGHGGIESMLFTAFLTASGLLNFIMLPQLASAIPPESLPAVREQIAALNAQPAWTGVLGFVERLLVIPAHIGFSIVVLQVFRRNSLKWLWIAIGLHMLVDLIPAVPIVLEMAEVKLDATIQSVLLEVLIAVYAVFSLWLIRRFYEPPPPPATPPPPLAAPEAALP